MDASQDGSVGPGAALAPGQSPAPAQPSVWHRPVSYRAQCWVAWAGLTAFGVRGAIDMYSGVPPDAERVIAIGLSVAWGIDLVRARSSER